MFNKFYYKIILFFAAFFVLLFSNVSAATSVITTTTTIPIGEPSTRISISAPTENQIIKDTEFLVAGKAPIGTIVTINITDEDSGNILFQHESPLSFQGTATSDKDGVWVFVPQQTLVPGLFSVYASYVEPSIGIINTDKVFFTIQNSSGQTLVIKDFFVWSSGTVLTLGLFLGLVTFLRVKKFKRQKKEEKEIEWTMERLSQETSKSLNELKKQLKQKEQK